MRMRTRSRRVGGAALALAIAGVALFALDAAASSDIKAPTTIVAVARFSHATVVDAAPAGFSAGDEQVVAGRLVQGGEQIGSFGFVCQFLTAGAAPKEDCSGTGQLPGGQITLHGFSSTLDSEHMWAITGGTGIYDNARGQVQIEDLSDAASRVTVEVIP